MKSVLVDSGSDDVVLAIRMTRQEWVAIRGGLGNMQYPVLNILINEAAARHKAHVPPSTAENFLDVVFNAPARGGKF
jgi:hypothetical protein